jgi:hypothetical protein
VRLLVRAAAAELAAGAMTRRAAQHGQGGGRDDT